MVQVRLDLPDLERSQLDPVSHWAQILVDVFHHPPRKKKLTAFTSAQHGTQRKTNRIGAAIFVTDC